MQNNNDKAMRDAFEAWFADKKDSLPACCDASAWWAWQASKASNQAEIARLRGIIDIVLRHATYQPLIDTIEEALTESQPNEGRG